MSALQEKAVLSMTGMAEEATVRLRNLNLTVTPIISGDYLGREGVSVGVKDETEHPTGAFKVRGAGSALSYYAAEGVRRVVAGSTGNHAKAVAWAAQALGLEAAIFMPERTDDAIVDHVRRYGAQVVLKGRCIDETLSYVEDYADQEDAENIHPYMHHLVRAGQATIGLELIGQAPDMTHLVLPVGGSGLLTGVAGVVKEHLENVKVVAAQVEGCDAFVQSLREGRPISLQQVDTRFGGVAVAKTDSAAFELAQKVTDGDVVVTPDEVYRAVYDHSVEHHRLLELAGAVGSAGTRHLIQNENIDEARIVTLATGSGAPPALKKFVDARARRLGWTRP